MKQRVAVPFVLNYILAFLLAASVGLQLLSDVDLGWHLAGGLWMFEHGRVPLADPLGIQASFWLCYSWLPELIMALAYKLLDFHGLYMLQSLYVLSVVLFLFFYQHQVRASAAGESKGVYLIELLSFGILLFFVAPMCTLRPQLLSIALYSFLLLLLHRKQLWLRYLLPLTVLWVNIHVYWVFVPVVVAVDKVLFGKRRVAGVISVVLLTLLGLLNPYGWKHFAGLFEYAFNHSEATNFIQEFQSVSLSLGGLLWVYLFLAAGFLYAIFSGYMKQRPSEALLGAVFLCASLNQVKYMPLFAVTVAPLTVNLILPKLCSIFSKSRLFKEENEPASIKGSSLVLLSLVLLAGFIMVLCCTSSVLEQRSEETLRIAKHLSTEERFQGEKGEKVSVLASFNEGGWLALGFMLNKNSFKTEFRTCIDGRTLVMGGERLAEYLVLAQRADGWPAVFRKWDPDLVLLSPDAKLLDFIPEQDDRWSRAYEDSTWVVLSKDRTSPG